MRPNVGTHIVLGACSNPLETALHELIDVRLEYDKHISLMHLNGEPIGLINKTHSLENVYARCATYSTST